MSRFGKISEKTIFTQMRVRRQANHTARYISCIFMMLAMAWLTISLPIVYSAQQTAEQKKAASNQAAEEETDGNFANNTTEEKTPRGGNSLSEEYHLHDTHLADQHTAIISIKYHIEDHSTYIAFYGDLESPPPDIA